MPVIGQIASVDAALSDTPGLVLSDPHGDGWMARIALADLDDRGAGGRDQGAAAAGRRSHRVGAVSSA